MSEEKELVVDKMNEILLPIGLFKTLSIDNVNHKPHRYMIGPKHVHHASDNHGGMLGTRTLNAVRCAQANCNIPYEEHTSDKVAFLQLQRNGKVDEANDELKKLIDVMKEAHIDGVVMVETDEQYRIT